MEKPTEQEIEDALDFYKKQAQEYQNEVIKKPDEFFLGELAERFGIENNIAKIFLAGLVKEGTWEKRKITTGKYKDRILYRMKL